MDKIKQFIAKYKKQIIGSCVMLLLLVWAFWYGGNTPGARGFHIDRADQGSTTESQAGDATDIGSGSSGDKPVVVTTQDGSTATDTQSSTASEAATSGKKEQNSSETTDSTSSGGGTDSTADSGKDGGKGDGNKPSDKPSDGKPGVNGTTERRNTTENTRTTEST